MSSPQSRIVELAAAIAQHTQHVDDYLTNNGLPHPSFHGDSPPDFELPPELEESRTTILRASQELNDLLQKPKDLLFNHQVRNSYNLADLQLTLGKHNLLVYLKFISRYNIANRIPLHGETAFKVLAIDIGIDEGAVARILRLAIARRIFCEPRPGFIAHSAASRQIAEDTRVADWVGANVDEMWPAAEKLVDALERWPQAAEPNQTGFCLAHGTDLSFYATLEREPERARRFGGAMSFFATGEGYSLSHLTDGYPWNSVASGTVVDLGGSHGDAAFALARKYPELHLIVQDLPAVVANTKEDGEINVKFMAHDFFEEQPVKGAEVYYYRWTLHNWPDKYCIKMLRALIPALKKGSRVLIMDVVMPPPGVLPNDLDRKLRALDLTMLEIGNAKERDLDEWKDLLDEADARLKFRNMYQPPGSTLAILEAVWDD